MKSEPRTSILSTSRTGSSNGSQKHPSTGTQDKGAEDGRLYNYPRGAGYNTAGISETGVRPHRHVRRGGAPECVWISKGHDDRGAICRAAADSTRYQWSGAHHSG